MGTVYSKYYINMQLPNHSAMRRWCPMLASRNQLHDSNTYLRAQTPQSFFFTSSKEKTGLHKTLFDWFCNYVFRDTCSSLYCQDDILLLFPKFFFLLKVVSRISSAPKRLSMFGTLTASLRFRQLQSQSFINCTRYQ